MLTFGKTSCSTSCFYRFISYFGMGKLINFFDSIFGTTGTKYLLQTNIGTSCFFNNFTDTVSVVCNFPTILGRTAQRNFNISSTLDQLMSYFLATVLNFNIAVTRNISATGCNIDITFRCIDSTIYNDLSIHKIRFGSCISSTWGISYGNKLLICCTRIRTPIIRIINVNVVTRTKSTFCILSNNYYGSWEECNILVDSNISRYCLYCHIVLNAKLILLGINRRCTDRHINSGNRYVTVCFQN